MFMKRVTTALRILLGLVLVMYSYAKFAGIQFPRMEIHDSVSTLNPVVLVFYFYGYSQPYAMFCATMEFIVGMLVILPRTYHFGLLCYFAFTLNIAVLDWCFNFVLETKLLITSLCLLSLVLIIVERKRIIGIVISSPRDGVNSG
jgi:hypothetical protein